VITRRVPFTTYFPISRSPTSSLRCILGRGVDGRGCSLKIILNLLLLKANLSFSLQPIIDMLLLGGLGILKVVNDSVVL
jgi:hypothetical protein